VVQYGFACEWNGKDFGIDEMDRHQEEVGGCAARDWDICNRHVYMPGFGASGQDTPYLGSMGVCCLLVYWRFVRITIPEEQAWTPGLTLLVGYAIYNYSTGSALIAFGLSGKQALAAGIFSPLALAALCVFCGVSDGLNSAGYETSLLTSITFQWIGGSHHVTYTVASRASWGMRGTWFAVAIRVMPGLVWDGRSNLPFECQPGCPKNDSGNTDTGGCVAISLTCTLTSRYF
jgi:hypothetical protein